ncbi:hypothetical protein EVAR_11546_1 [Eumeta japonica]|uniref:Uncharacterized protein n=1 Tax=Eumeta variegata TaxID=151549 RepID=A0A4C1TYS7_EUMVA|nr:hypothetical protein EVAR_11546_1 [Eumeta japonica]
MASLNTTQNDRVVKVTGGSSAPDVGASRANQRGPLFAHYLRQTAIISEVRPPEIFMLQNEGSDLKPTSNRCRIDTVTDTVIEA